MDPSVATLMDREVLDLHALLPAGEVADVSLARGRAPRAQVAPPQRLPARPVDPIAVCQLLCALARQVSIPDHVEDVGAVAEIAADSARVGGACQVKHAQRLGVGPSGRTPAPAEPDRA